MRDHIAIPVLTARPDGIITHVHWEPAWPRSPGSTFRANLTEDRKKAYSGNTTKASMKRLRQAILLIIEQAEEKTAINFKTKKPYTYKIAFVTLTLPAPQLDITDSQIHKKCFIPWLLRMRRRYGLRTYVWRREKQKNGNVHYHIIIDVWIDHANIRSHWNSCLEKLGFISRFHKKHSHSDPNSTDVHSIRKVKNLAAYMVKYLTKQAKANVAIEGKLWDCSINLKSKERCRVVGFGSEQTTISVIEKQLSHKRIECGFAHFYPLTKEEKTFILPTHYKKQYDEYLKRVRTFQNCKQREEEKV